MMFNPLKVALFNRSVFFIPALETHCQNKRAAANKLGYLYKHLVRFLL